MASLRKVSWNISFYASKWTNRVAIYIYIYIHILETVKIAHRPSVGDLIETWPCSTRLVFWPCGRVPSVPATKLLPIVRHGDARGQKRVKKVWRSASLNDRSRNLSHYSVSRYGKRRFAGNFTGDRNIPRIPEAKSTGRDPPFPYYYDRCRDNYSSLRSVALVNLASGSLLLQCDSDRSRMYTLHPCVRVVWEMAVVEYVSRDDSDSTF